jgi:hypothetical protein
MCKEYEYGCTMGGLELAKQNVGRSRRAAEIGTSRSSSSSSVSILSEWNLGMLAGTEGG